MEKNKVDELRQRILPVLLFCQANKGDLSLYESWKYRDDAGKKLFYSYYAGLFCRILCMLETASVLRHFTRDCDKLLEKYNWYDIQERDLELCKAAGPYGCEVPDAFEFIDGVDNVAWKDSGFKNGQDAVCIKMEHSSWTFVDIRGRIKPSKEE